MEIEQKRRPGRPKNKYESKTIGIRLKKEDELKMTFLMHQTGLNQTEIFRKILDNGYEYFLDNGHF